MNYKGPMKYVTWEQDSFDPFCGSYEIAYDPRFGTLVSKKTSSNGLFIRSRLLEEIGQFDVNITLIRADKPSEKVTELLRVTVLPE